MEIALETAMGEAPTPVTEKIDFANTPLAASPLAEVVAYHYAVHRISPDYLPQSDEQEATYLCVYRNAKDEVKFIELNGLSARLLLMLKEKPQSTLESMNHIAQEINTSNIDSFISDNLEIVETLLAQGVLHPMHSQPKGV